MKFTSTSTQAGAKTLWQLLSTSSSINRLWQVMTRGDSLPHKAIKPHTWMRAYAERHKTISRLAGREESFTKMQQECHFIVKKPSLPLHSREHGRVVSLWTLVIDELKGADWISASQGKESSIKLLLGENILHHAEAKCGDYYLLNLVITLYVPI